MNRPFVRTLLASILAATITLLISIAPAAAAGGTALGVKPQAEAETNAVSRLLVVGADVFIGDRIVTGPNGQVQIKFDDNTELVVGRNSSLVLEDYLLREDGSAGKLAINALSGTFRFVTGDSAKDRYTIRTPNGTIGVRGTGLDFNVDDIEGTRVLLYHGVVVLCNLQNVCVTLDGKCEIGTYDLSDARVLGPTDDLEDEIRDAFSDEFEYSNNQAPLLRDFWIDIARQCFNRPVELTTPISSASSTSSGPITVMPPAPETPDCEEPDGPPTEEDPYGEGEGGESCCPC